MDTAFWKSGDTENGETALVHLQPILVEQTQHTSNEETFFLNQEEGKGLVDFRGIFGSL